MILHVCYVIRLLCFKIDITNQNSVKTSFLTLTQYHLSFIVSVCRVKTYDTALVLFFLIFLIKNERGNANRISERPPMVV